MKINMDISENRLSSPRRTVKGMSQAVTAWLRLRTASAKSLPLLMVLLALPAVVQAQFTYTTNNGTITITGYTGTNGAVSIPSTINGLPVTSIGNNVFWNCTSMTSITIPNGVTNLGNGTFYNCRNLTSITIPDNVTTIGFSLFAVCTSLTNVIMGNNITSIQGQAFSACSSLTSITIPNSVTYLGDSAFADCSGLKAVYFKGNAPQIQGSFVFQRTTGAVVFILAESTGWGTIFAGRPTALWNLPVQTRCASFGVQTNQFGFTITGISNLVVVVEACTNLASPVWSPVWTNTLANGAAYFCDPQWTNYPGCFYRVRSP